MTKAQAGQKTAQDALQAKEEEISNLKRALLKKATESENLINAANEEKIKAKGKANGATKGQIQKDLDVERKRQEGRKEEIRLETERLQAEEKARVDKEKALVRDNHNLKVKVENLQKQVENLQKSRENKTPPQSKVSQNGKDQNTSLAPSNGGKVEGPAPAPATTPGKNQYNVIYKSDGESKNNNVTTTPPKQAVETKQSQTNSSPSSQGSKLKESAHKAEAAKANAPTTPIYKPTITNMTPDQIANKTKTQQELSAKKVQQGLDTIREKADQSSKNFVAPPVTADKTKPQGANQFK